MAKKDKQEAHIDEQMVEAVEAVEEVIAADVAAEQPASTTVEPVQLQINDLQGIGQIINLACKRGAFEAPEMEAIGKAYNKLNAFLGYVAAQASVAKADETTANETATAENTGTE